MGQALEVIGGFVTNPGVATLTALTPSSGDFFAVRAINDADGAFLEDFWFQEATPGIARIRSARLHDNNQGFRTIVPTATARGLMPDALEMRIYSTDTLIVEATGGAAETDVASLLIRYNNIGGLNANLMNWSDVKPRIERIMGQEVDPTSSATIGAWGPGRAINADFDNFYANRSYAILGYEVNTSVCSVTVKGVDTGNVRVGGPGTTEAIETRDWFIELSNQSGTPCIPIIQANNRGGTLVDVLASTASVACKVSFIMALLTP
jgi:hypothetical protein